MERVVKLGMAAAKSLVNHIQTSTLFDKFSLTSLRACVFSRVREMNLVT